MIHGLAKIGFAPGLFARAAPTPTYNGRHPAEWRTLFSREFFGFLPLLSRQEFDLLLLTGTEGQEIFHTRFPE